MKRYVYMIFLIFISVLFSALFSFAGVDRFAFYTFFFFISAFLCCLKPMTFFALFCIGDFIFARNDGVYIFMLFAFVLGVCIAYRKMGVYTSLLAGYLMCLAAGVVFAFFASLEISVIFDKLNYYFICFIFAPPVVFALRRAGLVSRKKARF